MRHGRASQFGPEYGDMGNDERGLAAGALGARFALLIDEEDDLQTRYCPTFRLCSHTLPGGRTRKIHSTVAQGNKQQPGDQQVAVTFLLGLALEDSTTVAAGLRTREDALWNCVRPLAKELLRRRDRIPPTYSQSSPLPKNGRIV